MRRERRKSRRQINRERYDKVHRLAKLILFGIQVVLAVLIAAVFILNELQFLLPLLLVKECLYYIGLNSVAYILENVFNYAHQHGRI